MSLRLKILASLYVAVGSVWLLHTAWQLHTFEEAFIASEVRATSELAVGLRVYLRHLTHESGTHIKHADFRCCERDVMLIDRDYVVLAASNPERVGTTWTETGIEAVMRGEVEFAYSDHEHSGSRVIDVTVPIEGPTGTTEYVLHAARSQNLLQEELRRHRRDHLLMLAAAFGLMALLVSGFTHRMILRPLAQIRARIGMSPWGLGLGSHATPDLDVLRRTVDAMLARIEADRANMEEAVAEKSELLLQVQGMKHALEEEVDRVKSELKSAEKSLLRAERHAALGQLSGALAHELRNPLHIVRGLAETVGRRQPDVAPFTDDIKSEVDRIDMLIRQLLQYTRPLDLERRDVGVEELITSVCDRVARARADRGQRPCKMVVATDTAQLSADPVLVEQALENLIENACDAAGPDGEVTIGVEMGDAAAVITVHDDGPGIPEERLETVFEPFVTGKPAGTGLGLCVAQRIVEMHGGELELSNRPEGGLDAVIRLPYGECTDEQDSCC
ncbi:MAG: sensor histidine kinase [Myxococcota bacterium]